MFHVEPQLGCEILLPYMTIHVETWLFWIIFRNTEAIWSNTELFSDKQKQMCDFGRTSVAKNYE